VAALSESVPGIEPDVRLGFSQPLLEALVAKELDAAILFCPGYQSCLCYQRLSDQQAVAVMHPDHRLAGHASLRMRDLSDEIIAVAPPAIGKGYNTAVGALCRREGVMPRIVESMGYTGPVDFAANETVGITTEFALATVRTSAELVRIPLEACTLPYDRCGTPSASGSRSTQCAPLQPA
jgi:DNA-binding transcriptional LysR family regulator